MALMVRPEPFSREVDRFFDAFFDQSQRTSRRWVPPMDLVEAEDHFVLKADLPGLREEDVKIEVQDGTLTIAGERKAENDQREHGCYRIERSFGSFSRSLTLPDRVNTEAISAEFRDGVLELQIPKPEERKPQRIEIRTSGNGDAQRAAVEGTAQES